MTSNSFYWPVQSNNATTALYISATTGIALIAGLVGYQRLSGTGGKGRPPIVPSYIPWVGSSWEMDRNPDEFMRVYSAKYPGGVFGVKVHGRTLYFVTSAKLINQIYKQSKVFSMNPVQVEWLETVFSLSRSAIYEKQVLFASVGPHMIRSLAPKNMMNFVEQFNASLIKTISDIARSLPSASVPLHRFIYDLEYKSTGYACFGPTFPADSMDLFSEFDEGVWKVAAGYPPNRMPKFVQARERLLDVFTKYLEEDHEAGEFLGGMEEIGKAADLDRRDMGVQILSSWWPLVANLPHATYWAIALQLQRPEKFRDLIAELDAAGKVWEASHPEFTGSYIDHLAEFFSSSPSIPLLTSTISEMLRYTTDSWSMRGVQAEGTQLGDYQLKQGDILVCGTRQVHLDAEEFGENAAEYNPRRFMGDGDKGKEGSYNWMPWGGGISMCLGRHFAYYHIKMSIARLIKTFQFDLDESKDNRVGTSKYPFGGKGNSTKIVGARDVSRTGSCFGSTFDGSVGVAQPHFPCQRGLIWGFRKRGGEE